MLKVGKLAGVNFKVLWAHWNMKCCKIDLSRNLTMSLWGCWVIIILDLQMADWEQNILISQRPPGGYDLYLWIPWAGCTIRITCPVLSVISAPFVDYLAKTACGRRKWAFVFFPYPWWFRYVLCSQGRYVIAPIPLPQGSIINPNITNFPPLLLD